MRLLFLLLFVTINAISQSITLPYDIGAFRQIAPDTINKKIHLFFDDFREEIDLPSFNRKISKLYTETDFNIREYMPVAAGSKIYMIKMGGGIVYTLRNDSLVRIDQSFEHKMQWGANFFEHDRKLFAFGGYGFWSVRDFFIYFDESLKEWELYNPKPLNRSAPEIFDGIVRVSGDDFYVFDGHTINPLERQKRIHNNEVWHYSFKKHEWTWLGSTDDELHQTSNRLGVYMDGVFFDFGGRRFHVTTGGIEVLDVENNKRTYYKHGLFSARSSALTALIFEVGGRICIVKNMNQFIRIDIINPEQFLGEKISETELYHNSSWWVRPLILYILTPMLAVFGLWKLIGWYKRKRKVVLLSNGLTYKNKFAECDEETMTILKTLLKKNVSSSNEILSIVEKEQFSPAHNERIKVQKISDLNIRLRTLTGTREDIIKSVKSADDKRIRNYMINKRYFNV